MILIKLCNSVCGNSKLISFILGRTSCVSAGLQYVELLGRTSCISAGLQYVELSIRFFAYVCHFLGAQETVNDPLETSEV